MIRREVQSCLDSKMRKLTWSVWSMIAGGIGSLIFLGVQWGTIKAQVSHNTKDDARHHSDHNLHMPADAKYQIFVTRAEWQSMVKEREKDAAEIKTAIERLGEKFDRLISRQGAE